MHTYKYIFMCISIGMACLAYSDSISDVYSTQYIRLLVRIEFVVRIEPATTR